MDKQLEQYLKPATGIECDNPRIVELAAEITAGCTTDDEKARALFNWVRDEVAYTMNAPFWDMKFYLATSVIDRGEGYCVQKSCVLTTLARAAGIPSRMCFADIENLAIDQEVVDLMGGTRLFTYHSYTEWFIDGQWRMATPTFDKDLCQRKGYPVVEYSSGENLMLPEKTLDGSPYIKYKLKRGHRDELPLAEIMDSWIENYSAEGIELWRQHLAAELGINQ